MIIGVGTDLISVARIEEKFLKLGEKFTNRIFTKKEIEQASKLKNKSNFYAKRFAAKEAFSKAAGLGIGRGINFLDIEISNNDLGKPLIKVINNKESFLIKHFACEKLNFHLSLSDEKNMALAMVIIEKI